MNIVKLTPQEIEEATNFAKIRSSSSRSANLKNANIMEDVIDIDIQGAIGEMAASKFFNLPWVGRIEDATKVVEHNKSKRGDIAGIEVRFTRHINGGLILRPKDRDDGIYVLVNQVNPGTYEVSGWMIGKDAKIPKYESDPGNRGKPCYLVPKKDLKKINMKDKTI